MIAECLLDADVLACAALRHPDEAGERKRRIALDLIEGAKFGTSGQVLQEFAVIVMRRAKPPLPAPMVHDWIEKLSLRPVAPVDTELVLHALLIGERYKLTPYQAGVVAAAGVLGAPVIYSQDLAHGAAFGSIRVRNPFIEDGSGEVTGKTGGGGWTAR
jgi:predicted nucleic acid-binding protein